MLVQRVNPRHDEIINKYKSPNSWFLGSLGCFLFFWPFKEDEIEVTSAAPAVSRAMAHLWCVHSSVPRAPGAAELGRCGAAHQGGNPSKACGICSSLDPAFPTQHHSLLLLPVPQPPWGHLVSTVGFTTEELSGSRAAAHTVPISTSRFKSR